MAHNTVQVEGVLHNELTYIHHEMFLTMFSEDLPSHMDAKLKKWKKFFLVMRTLMIYSVNNFHVKFIDVFIGGVSDKEPTCQCRRHNRPGLHPGSGIFPGEGNGNPLQYSCLENPMDRGAWWATVHGVMKRQTRLR